MEGQYPESFATSTALTTPKPTTRPIVATTSSARREPSYMRLIHRHRAHPALLQPASSGAVVRRTSPSVRRKPVAAHATTQLKPAVPVAKSTEKQVAEALESTQLDAGLSSSAAAGAVVAQRRPANRNLFGVDAYSDSTLRAGGQLAASAVSPSVAADTSKILEQGLLWLHGARPIPDGLYREFAHVDKELSEFRRFSSYMTSTSAPAITSIIRPMSKASLPAEISAHFAAHRNGQQQQQQQQSQIPSALRQFKVDDAIPAREHNQPMHSHNQQQQQQQQQQLAPPPPSGSVTFSSANADKWVPWYYSTRSNKGKPITPAPPVAHGLAPQDTGAPVTTFVFNGKGELVGGQGMPPGGWRPPVFTFVEDASIGQAHKPGPVADRFPAAGVSYASNSQSVYDQKPIPPRPMVQVERTIATTTATPFPSFPLPVTPKSITVSLPPPIPRTHPVMTSLPPVIPTTSRPLQIEIKWAEQLDHAPNVEGYLLPTNSIIPTRAQQPPPPPPPQFPIGKPSHYIEKAVQPIVKELELGSPTSALNFTELGAKADNFLSTLVASAAAAHADETMREAERRPLNAGDGGRAQIPPPPPFEETIQRLVHLVAPALNKVSPNVLKTLQGQLERYAQQPMNLFAEMPRRVEEFTPTLR